jgi:tetraacyldisaccharide 4'-kinase
VERFARRWWAGELGVAGRALSTLAAPASWAWAGASRARVARGRAQERVHGVAVVSVGNLAVGGTGKTPLAAWAARVLHASGVPTSVLVGAAGADEALLHARWNPGVPVLTDADRVRSARQARARGAAAVVLDDGFQHLALARDLDLVLLSADDRFPAPVFPCGPYREPVEALGRAHALVVTRRSASVEAARSLARSLERLRPGLTLAGVHLADGGWARLDGTPGAAPAGDVLAVSGLARAAPFGDAVRRRVEGAVELVAFADHQAYTGADVERLVRRARGRAIVLPEKDAVKLAPLAAERGDFVVLGDRLLWDWGEEALRARVLACVAEGAAR